jgi:beta-lactamase class A
MMDMDYGRLGERRRRLRFPLLEIGASILLLIAIVMAMLELVAYSNQKDQLPTDLTVAEVAVGGLNETDAQARWESVYNQAIQLRYDGSLIVLFPSEINFRINSEAMLAEARSQSGQEKNFWAGFWNFLERRPVAAVQVPLIASYPESDLRHYLEAIAARYDSTPGDAGFDMLTLTFRSGRAGRQLDIDAAIPLIDRALYDPEAANRQVTLPLKDMASAQQDINTLRDAILALMRDRGFVYDGPNTVASVYIMDLATGEEINIQSDVPFSALSTIKIPIMINLFRSELLVPNGTEVAYLLTESILCSNNSASNWLIQLTGTGFNENASLGDGLNRVSCGAQALGAEHTYISAPLYVGDERLEFEAPVCRPKTPGNTAYNTEADAFSQTTAEDMGLLLTEIYDCATNGGGLKAIYPDDITQTECRQMFELLSGNRIDRLIELGVPLGTRVAHKNAWGPPGTSGDAGIVFSPSGDYVLVMYTYERYTNEARLSTIAAWELIEEVSRLVYNYFNPDQPLLQRRDPILPLNAIECVTVLDPADVNLDEISANRLDENGNPLPTACYGGAGHCHPFDNWGRQ